MNWESFIQDASFATVLTALVTIATCIITYLHGIRKMKIEKFNEIYDCLEKLAKQKSRRTKHLGCLIKEIGEAIPENMAEVSTEGDINIYRNVYHEYHKFLMEYSRYLESLMSFYRYLYKDMPNIPAVKEECWVILRLYGTLTAIKYKGAEECGLEYYQIVTLIQFIKIYSGFWGKTRLYRYFRENKVFKRRRECLVRAFFFV